MNNSLFIKANQAIRKTRPFLPNNKVCQVFFVNYILEIGFLSKQCRNDAAGTCIMCDYGCAIDTCANSVYINEMRNILIEYAGRSNHLLLCTNGSFMDEYQISSDLFIEILTEAGRHDFPIIEIETHYRSVTKDKLDLIHHILPQKQIIIEMGLETTNHYLHKSVIMKNIELKSFDKTIQMIKKYNFGVDLNIMLGMPFLDTKEQFDDTQKTVNWAFERDCRAVIFPINIKPFTLLWHMHQLDYYSPISHWLLILFLESISIEKLDQVTVAWFGNREELYEQTNKRAIFPTSCPICHSLLMDFYDNFNNEVNSEKRKKLIHNLIKDADCSCLDKQLSLLNQKQNMCFEKKYKSYHERLLRDYQTGSLINE